jgi:aspartate/methionine/tyrosine aminotransferase
MRLQPDALNAWLNEHHFSEPPVAYDLAASTGPVWTLSELLALGAEQLPDLELSYVHSKGGRELRNAIAEMAGVEAHQVQVTTGAAEALWIVFMLAAEPGANVVVPGRPCFPTFHEAPAVLGMKVRSYAVDAEFWELARLVDRRTRVIVVNRPHNPTGAAMPDSLLERLHDLAVECGAQLVVDEVFHPIYHGPAPASATRLPGATVVGDFSKALSLSGLRLGWIVERDPARLAQYEHARSYFTVSSTSVGERLGLIALAHRDRIYARARITAARNLALLDRFFAEHRERFDWVPPRGGFTAFPWLRSGESSRPLCRAAVAAGVLLAPGECFGAPAHFRVGLGATEDGFEQALERLDAVLTGVT